MPVVVQFQKVRFCFLGRNEGSVERTGKYSFRRFGRGTISSEWSTRQHLLAFSVGTVGLYILL
jgi:hypothetical protein